MYEGGYIACFTFVHISISIILVILYRNFVSVKITNLKLLHCPIISLLTLTSSSYTCNLLLYGNPCYDFHTNKKILELTICFIISSKRFDGPFISNDFGLGIFVYIYVTFCVCVEIIFMYCICCN